MKSAGESVAGHLAALRDELGDVRLLAVSKGQSCERIRAAFVAGQCDFAENYLQEAETKMREIALADIRWHFIGRLQRNKARRVAERFDWLHSVDREQLLAPLQQGRGGLERPLNVCLQVNISARPERPGAHPDDLAALAAAVADKPKLRLRGLMCMASPDAAAARGEFARMKQLYDGLAAQHPQVDTLCMGISGDWKLAVAAGANMVRLGTAVFGERTPKTRHSSPPAQRAAQ